LLILMDSVVFLKGAKKLWVFILSCLSLSSDATTQGRKVAKARETPVFFRRLEGATVSDHRKCQNRNNFTHMLG